LLLRDFLLNELADWQGDLSPAWQAFFQGVELDFDKLPACHRMKGGRLLIPPRWDQTSPRTTVNVFRAFADLEPRQVRVLVIGQDPYPQAGRATGRSFEDGLFVAWDGKVARSLMSLRRAAMASRLDRPELMTAAAIPWKKLIVETAAAAERCDEPLDVWFDRMAEQGVLFVNAAMTLTHYEYGGGAEQAAHLLLWRPFVQRLVLGLVKRPAKPIVYLLLGKFAQELFLELTDGSCADDREASEATFSSVEHWHPSYYRFLDANPLTEVNVCLSKLGSPAISW
jgi:uracil-DNA glycosylase